METRGHIRAFEKNPEVESHIADSVETPFRLMVEAVVDYAVFMLDPHGNVLTWNHGAERMKQYTAEQIIGKHVSVFYPQELIDQGFPEKELRIAAEQGRFEDEGWRIRRDRSRLWAGVTITALHAEDGTVVGFGKVTRDLTERCLADRERSLTTEQREQLSMPVPTAYDQLRAVTDSLADGILEADFNWTICFGNLSAARVLPDFGIGRSLWECFPDLVGTFVEEHLRRAMEQHSCVSYENYYPPYKVWLRVRVSPTSRGLAIIFTDVTKEKTLEAQLQVEATLREQRIEALSHMAAGLAHEISNPLAVIHAKASDLVEALADRSSDEALLCRPEVESIIGMADRASAILRGLRGFAREASGDPMEPASMCAIIEGCVEMQQSRFDRESVALRIELPDNIPPLLCREVQIGQIITNLINNGFDAITHEASEERWVLIRASRLGRSVLVSVTDSGPGLADHFRNHLMEAFFTTKKKGLGMGIGLSLSRAIAEAHGGTLVLAVDGPPTRFDLTLPLDPSASREREVAEQQ